MIQAALNDLPILASSGASLVKVSLNTSEAADPSVTRILLIEFQSVLG